METAYNFLDLLKMNGHSGARISISTIESKLNQGIHVAVQHYQKYLKNAEVRKLTPAEITKAIKDDSIVWTVSGIITKSKLNVPQMNGVLLLNENMTDLAKYPVIIVPN